MSAKSSVYQSSPEGVMKLANFNMDDLVDRFDNPLRQAYRQQIEQVYGIPEWLCQDQEGN